MRGTPRPYTQRAAKGAISLRKEPALRWRGGEARQLHTGFTFAHRPHTVLPMQSLP